MGLLPRFASKLDLGQQTQTMAIDLLQKITNSRIASGRRPETLAAAALYIAGKLNDEKRTQRQISNAT